MALLASTALLAGLSQLAHGQTYAVVLSINDARPVGQAVLSLIRSYPVTITYEDPRYEYPGDLRDVTRRVDENRGREPGTIVPRGGALQATYDVSQGTGEPVDMAGAIQSVVDANNVAPRGGRFELRRIGETFHVVPTEVRDSNGRWIAQKSVLDTPITFTSAGERDGFELIEAVLHELSVASGQEIVGVLPTAAMACGSLACTQNKRTVDARDEPARVALVGLLRSLSPRYTWMLYYDPAAHRYLFNLVLGVQRPDPESEHDRRRRPGDPTPGVPFNVASAR